MNAVALALTAPVSSDPATRSSSSQHAVREHGDQAAASCHLLEKLVAGHGRVLAPDVHRAGPARDLDGVAGQAPGDEHGCHDGGNKGPVPGVQASPRIRAHDFEK